MELKCTVYHNGTDQDLTVDFTYTPGEPDVYYLSNGDPGYPGCSPEIEIVAVEDDHGRPFDEDGDMTEELVWDDYDNWSDQLEPNY